MKPRVPSTPEQALANVALEADFHEACTALRVELNERLNELHRQRSQVKENAQAHLRAINHSWAVERANINAAIDRLADERAHLRQMLHDGFNDDVEPIRNLTEQIHEQRLHRAEVELAHQERVKDARLALADAIAELGKQAIALREEFHNRHSELRRKLAELVHQNREARARRQEGGEL